MPGEPAAPPKGAAQHYRNMLETDPLPANTMARYKSSYTRKMD